MINIVGLGPGDINYTTHIGFNLINESDVLIGGRRNLESIQNFKGEKIELNTNLKEIVQYLQDNMDEKITIIASGDPLLYGIGKYISSKIDNEKLNIVSGISSTQYLFSRVKIDMNDLYLTSSHGKTPDFDYILSHKKVCMVTDTIIGPKQISEEIINRKLDKLIVVGENLSYPNEKITVGTPEEILNIDNFDMCVVIMLEKNNS